MRRAVTIVAVVAFLLYGAALIAFDKLLDAIFGKRRKWSGSWRMR